jgi:drug/metabolite transporter (DMT)-like permease
MATALAWGGADLFYKKGSDKNDKYSHIKITIAVGFVMGVHAVIYYFAKGVEISVFDVIRYLPVSFFYIASMVVGYAGLRYLELSISSPVENASGGIVAVLCVVFFHIKLSVIEIIGVILLTVGVIGIAVFDRDKVDLKVGGNKKYTISFFAILFPLIYCLLDALGTFADAIYLDELKLITEDAALIAYEATFFLAAAVCFIYLKIKKIKFNPIKEKEKGIAAVMETAGQFFYVYAMSANAVIAAPLIAAYSVFSVLFSRIFLKEKLKVKQYIVIGIVIAGIILLGISEGLSD